MANLDQLERALVNADAAGDAESARVLATEIKRLKASGGSGEDTGALGTASAAAGNFIGGVPIIGPVIKGGAERAAAGIRSWLYDTSYGDELKAVQDYAQRTTEENPVTSTAAGIGGAVAGTVPLVMAAPAAFGAGAGGLTARSLASMISGGALGGGDAAVRSGGNLQEAGTGALVGGALGVAAPTAARGIGRGTTWLADRIMGLSSPTGPMTGISRPAAKFALDALGASPQRAALQADLNRLGPEAMLADVSPEWMGVARGAASRPGMRDEIVTPLLARDATKNARLRSDMNAALGEPHVPSQIDAGIAANQRALGPEYGQAIGGARAVNTQPIAQALEADSVNLRGPAQRAARDVRGMLDIHGAPGNLDPHPGTLFQTRQAIDGLLRNEADPNVIQALTGYRQQIDAALADSVPGIKGVDAKYSELARQREALTRGQQVLESGRTAPRPQELAEEVTSGALPQGQMIGPSAVPLRLQQGARAEIERVAGTSANDPAALQKLVRSEGDWNRDRLRTLFGPRADDALNAIDRETQFYRTNNRVTSGSDTAMASRFGDFLDSAAKPNKVPTETTMFGAALRGSQKVVQALMGANSEAKAQRFAEALGRLSVARGSERDQIVEALLGMARRRESLDPINDQVVGIARGILASSPPVANQLRLGR